MVLYCSGNHLPPKDLCGRRLLMCFSHYSGCSDILTPLPALGVPFEIDDAKGPIIADPVRSIEQVKAQQHRRHADFSMLLLTMNMLQVQRLHSIDLQQLQFVGDALTCLRQEVDGQVSSPFKHTHEGIESLVCTRDAATSSLGAHVVTHRQLCWGLWAAPGPWQPMSLRAAALVCTKP